MKNRRSSCAAVVALALGGVLVAPSSARAIDWNLRIDAGLAGLLPATQGRLFGVGGGASLHAAITPLPFLDLHLLGGVLAFGAKDENPNDSPGLAWQVGGGFRLKRPSAAGFVSPWLELDVAYVRTGPLDRFGFSVGAGVAFAMKAIPSIRLGPFLRYAQIVTPYDDMLDVTDAKILIGGISVEYGPGRRQKPAATIVSGAVAIEGTK